MRSPKIARLALGLLCASALLIGLTATIAPEAFYDDFPFFTRWVDLLPPYNQHLVTDVGGLYLGFAIIFGWAARTLERPLVRAASAGWLLTATLHFIFHLGHLDGFSAADAIAELFSLAFLIGAPVVALWAGGRDSDSNASGSSNGPQP